MKHVFFVHSHITWLVSRGVIRQRQLQRQDVLFVCTRGYEPPGGEHERIVFPHRSWAITWRLARWLRQRRELARFVDQVARDGEFLWYLPHTGFPFFPAFVGHPMCRGFHLIEEGIGSYCTLQDLDDITRRTFALKPGWKGWMLRRWMQLKPPRLADPRYLVAYGCTDEAFPGYPRRSTVDIAGEPPAGWEGIATVLVFDNILEASLASEEAFFRCVDELVARLAQEGRRGVHYKLHPDQYVDRRFTLRLQQALRDNANGVRFTELPPGYCLELLAAAGGRPDFYVFGSSVGFYAAASGCRVFSMAGRLAALDPGYQVVVDTMPQVIRRRLVFL